MSSNRFVQLAGLLNEDQMPVAKFASKFEDERVKLLWQWSTSKQMDLGTWKSYLEAHCKACAADEMKLD